VLDRLRDRQKDEWQIAETQSDLQNMDSLALTRFSKQNPQLSDDV
jgi:flagellar biosynthesis chaperone FliJ